MKKTIDVTEGMRPDIKIDAATYAFGQFAQPRICEVSGHCPVYQLVECWNCVTIFHALIDPNYYKYVRCPGCGSINKF